MGYVSNPVHIVILLGIALLLFGGKRLPEIGRSLGSGMREFKDAITGNTPEPHARAPARRNAQRPSSTTPPPSRRW